VPLASGTASAVLEDPSYDLVFDPGRPSPSEFEKPIFRYFSGKRYHCWHLRSPVDTGRLMRDFASSLMRSEIGWNPKGPQEVYRLLFRPRPGVFIHVEAGELIVFASSQRQIATMRASLLPYVLREVAERPKFVLIDEHSGGAYATPVKLGELGQVASIAMGDLPLLYGQDFPEWERLWFQRMDSRGTGLSIFSGPTGTGKTSYLRHLVERLGEKDTHSFYYIPTSFAAVLTSPEYVNFWVAQNQYQKHRQKVAILEDSEDLLLKRDEASCSKVSNLLNVTDGFLSDQLGLQIIATVNCQLEELDPAIARPGRLVGYRQFRRLTRLEASRLAAEKGLSLNDQQDFSLAEIFFPYSIGPDPSQRTDIGFRK